ncbi:hypothetical protein QAD02_023332 [Eretmocerus hayati]|uniref:Uncharacterized protein n=1 Tax=Eretmocerus hayati TaxID=131215 RepID=A0ACC2PX64_9HYME|nr:hypothetical protein QAD02_023332 [Eretmocerus hayati]
MKKPVVKTQYGKLRGSVEKSIEGYQYCAFKGVPYAKPPVGALRFQDPQYPEPWKGVRDALEFGPVCAQFDQFFRTFVGCDDCLYLNIYVKTTKPKKRLPVMIFIHGGAFTFGCGDDTFYGPDYLLRKDVVLVTLNYRLGVLGFLDLEHEAAPGNQGLKDLVMALKWVQNNIAAFGGDPTNVTIFGESSGGAAVNYLCLSPRTKGLFHKAASQSGSALNPWASTPHPRQFAFRICKLLGKETEDPWEVVEFLRSIHPLDLAKMQEKMRTNQERVQLLFPFGPGVDDKSKEPFMPVPISIAAKNGIPVPYISGYNSQEGIYALSIILGQKMESIDREFKHKMIHPNTHCILKEHNITVDDLMAIYDFEILNENDYVEKIMHLLGDMYVLEGMHKTIRLHLTKNLQTPIYLYKFTYDKGVSFTKLMLNKDLKGASHFDELSYLFSMKFRENLGIDNLQKGTSDYRLMEQMTEMWTNFAKTGNPTPSTSGVIRQKWTTVSNATIMRYLEIDVNSQMKQMISVEQNLSRRKFTKSRL